MIKASVLRVLCLHGHMQSAEIFRTKLGAIPRKLKEVAVFHFLDGPIILPLKEGDDESVRLRSWIDRDSAQESKRVASLETTLELIRDAWDTNGPFDGIFGFSMGGLIATIVATIPKEYPALKFLVIAGAPNFNAQIFSFEPYLSMSIEVPKSLKSLHMIGEKDGFVTPSRSRALAESLFHEPVIIEHPQGHLFPTKSLYIEKYAEFLRQFLVRSGVDDILQDVSIVKEQIRSPRPTASLGSNIASSNGSNNKENDEYATCVSLLLISQQTDELEVLSSIFPDEMTVIHPPPTALKDPSTCIEVTLQPLSPDPPLPSTWLGNIKLNFTLPSSYPEAVLRVSLVTDQSLSMMDFPTSVRAHLLQVARQAAVEGLGTMAVMSCVQAANDWLATGGWRNIPTKGSSTTHLETADLEGGGGASVIAPDKASAYASQVLSELALGREEGESLSQEQLGWIEDQESVLVGTATAEACSIAARSRFREQSLGIPQATAVDRQQQQPHQQEDDFPQPRSPHFTEEAQVDSARTVPSLLTEEPAPSFASSLVSSSSRGLWTYTIGLVGKPSAGKSTFFNAATRALLSREGRLLAEVAPHPFTTIEPNVGPGWYAAPPDGPFTPVKGVDGGNNDRAACHGRDAHGRRLLPVIVKDVAGLVPGAYKGRGKGNRFLNDLCDADVLVHVVDVTGRADKDGNAVVGREGGSTPSEDARWIREELHRWIHGNVLAKWSSVGRKEKSGGRVIALFSGYHSTPSVVREAARRARLDLDDAVSWTRLDLHRMVAHYLSIRFPVCLALNKIDALPIEEVAVGSAHSNVVSKAIQEALLRGEVAVPVSARAENAALLALLANSGQAPLQPITTRAGQEASDSAGATTNVGGGDNYKDHDVLSKVLNVWGGTGVLDALSAAVSLRPPVFCFPVSDLQSEAPLGWSSGHQSDLSVSIADPPKLQDCLQFKPGSTVGDVVEALRYCSLKHVSLAGCFVRAEGRGLDRSSRKMQVGRDTVLDESICVLRIQMNRKPVLTKSF